MGGIEIEEASTTVTISITFDICGGHHMSEDIVLDNIEIPEAIVHGNNPHRIREYLLETYRDQIMETISEISVSLSDLDIDYNTLEIEDIE